MKWEYQREDQEGVGSYFIESLRHGSLSIASYLGSKLSLENLKDHLFNPGTIDIINESTKTFKWYLELFDYHKEAILSSMEKRIQIFCRISLIIKSEAVARLLVNDSLFVEVFSGDKRALSFISNFFNQINDDDEINNSYVMHLNVAKIIFEKSPDLFLPLNLHYSYFLHAKPADYIPEAVAYLKKSNIDEVLNIVRVTPVENLSDLLEFCNFNKQGDFRRAFIEICDLYSLEETLKIAFDSENTKKMLSPDFIYENLSLNQLYELLGCDFLPERLLLETIYKKKNERSKRGAKPQRTRRKSPRRDDSESDSSESN